MERVRMGSQSLSLSLSPSLSALTTSITTRYERVTLVLKYYELAQANFAAHIWHKITRHESHLFSDAERVCRWNCTFFRTFALANSALVHIFQLCLTRLLYPKIPTRACTKDLARKFPHASKETPVESQTSTSLAPQ